MQLTSTSSLQQSQLDYNQLTLNTSSNSGVPQLPPLPPQDRIEFSDEARRSQDREDSVGQVRKAPRDGKDNPLFDFLKNVLGQITGAQIHDLQNAPAAADTPAPAKQSTQTSVSAQQASLSFETSSLSIDGSITASDGGKLSFSLDLQMMHASASASSFNLASGSNGYDFSFAGSSAELTSTSFSFSLTAETPGGTPVTGGGLGSFSLKDDVKEVRHALKPLIKEFLKEADVPSDWRSVNQLLHTIA
ncbi:MAG TPA: hypothetical protein VIK40_08915 [Geomonas sp.]